MPKLGGSLTEAGLDYPDCMPPRESNSIELPADIKEEFEKLKKMSAAERAEYAGPSKLAPPPTAE